MYDRSTGLFLEGSFRGDPILYHMGLIDTGSITLQDCNFDLGPPNIVSMIAIFLFENVHFILIGVGALAIIYYWLGDWIKGYLVR